MIKLENYEVIGWKHAIRGMRNPMNSWGRSDSTYCGDYDECDDCPAYIPGDIGYCYTAYQKSDRPGVPIIIGENDHELMMKLAKGGSVHAKYRRMIAVYVDITAPLYWWKEFDTYKVGTVANSCSTMHKIHDKEFFEEDFSFEKIRSGYEEYEGDDGMHIAYCLTQQIISALGRLRYLYNTTKKQKYWDAMIQLLPSSYNQKRTVMLNYEVLTNIYRWRKNHKLDEWVEFCKWIEQLPYSEIITGPSLDDIPICNEIMNEAKKRVMDGEEE